MSLVICSNQEKDGVALRQQQSVYNAWSFRNPLSSTMTIPAHAQVALQSCKVNVDGRVAFTNNNSKFYHYFGEKLLLTSTADQNSTSVPVITQLTNENESSDVVELSNEEFALRIQEQVRTTSYHPNTKGQFECAVLRNGSSRDFLGYKYSFIQNSTNTNSIPADNTFRRFFSEFQDLNASYTSGIFQRNASVNDTSAGINIKQPFSLTNGSFIVNLSGTNADANASGVAWCIGLSRFVRNPQTNTGQFAPDVFDFSVMDDMELNGTACFMDFGVARNELDELVVFQSSRESSDRDVSTTLKEVRYFENTNSSFTAGGRADWTGNASSYTKLGFFSNGEDIAVKLYNGAAWHLVTEFDAGEDADTYFKPVNQCCWCLHPTISIGTDGTNNSCKVEIEEFSSPNISDYDPLIEFKGGWFENMELQGTQYLCGALEQSTWNHPDTNDRTYKELNASGGVSYDAVMILQPNDIYVPSYSANATELLGFKQAIVDTPASGDSTDNTIIYESEVVPDLISSLALFVRLNNMGQQSTNAFTKNKSKILAHLTNLETQTGRLTYEPNTLIFLDLDNPAPMQVNEFDISFNYINEQYATILTGQSIVSLYFRKKPKELM